AQTTSLTQEKKDVLSYFSAAMTKCGSSSLTGSRSRPAVWSALALMLFAAGCFLTRKDCEVDGPYDASTEALQVAVMIGCAALVGQITKRSAS
ncbi:unnamed protein product, partial [Effrenium voratum]